MKKTDQENQAICNYDKSFQVEASTNAIESNLTEPNPSTFVNNTNNTTIKKRQFKSPQKRDWNSKNKKFETSKLTSSETDIVIAAVKK